MKTTKNTKKIHHKKTKNTRRKQHKKTYRKRGGGCGCGQTDFQLSSIWKGGNNLILNNSLPDTNTQNTHWYYPLNTYSHDPTGSNILINSRNLPNPVIGGKHKKKMNKISKKSMTKKRRGGGIFTYMFQQNEPNNAMLNNNTTNDSYNFSQMNGLAPIVSSNSTVQPVLSFYNNSNPPLA